MEPISFQGHCYSKREERTWPLLFMNNNGPFFFLRLPPLKISGAFATLKKIGQILHGTLQMTSKGAD
jgi:hypothetical protein